MGFVHRRAAEGYQLREAENQLVSEASLSVVEGLGPCGSCISLLVEGNYPSCSLTHDKQIKIMDCFVWSLIFFLKIMWFLQYYDKLTEVGWLITFLWGVGGGCQLIFLYVDILFLFICKYILMAQ